MTATLLEFPGPARLASVAKQTALDPESRVSNTLNRLESDLLLEVKKGFEEGEISFAVAAHIASLIEQGRMTEAESEAEIAVGIRERSRRQAEAVVIASLSALIQRGRIDQAIDSASRATAERISTAYRESVRESGRRTAASITRGLGLDRDFLFNDAQGRVIDDAVSRSGELVREITRNQREAINQAWGRSVNRGDSVQQQALAIRSSLNLTARQQASVENFRESLERVSEGDSRALSRQLRDRQFDDQIRTARRRRRPLTPEQIDRMVDRYRARLVSYRSETIARTEALRALGVGMDAAYRQAIERQIISGDRIVRTWISARDPRVRDTHAGLDGQKRGINETWETRNGVLRYPGDPSAPASEVVNCRCVLQVRVESVA